MEKETFDFSAAKVGDLVSNPTYGKGKIYRIETDSRPIGINFNSGCWWFTIDGRLNSSELQSLYHGHIDFVITPVEPCPYGVGEWIAVGTGDGWILRQFAKMDKSAIIDSFGEMWDHHHQLSFFNKKEV